jgi:hypothetical protein
MKVWDLHAVRQSVSGHVSGGDFETFALSLSNGQPTIPMHYASGSFIF